MNHCAKFLRAIGPFYKAFYFHNKGASYEKKTAEEAIGLVGHRKTVLEEHAYEIRAESNSTGALNGSLRSCLCKNSKLCPVYGQQQQQQQHLFVL